MSDVTVLVAGDLHLGRSSSRVPAGTGLDPSARGALGRLVDAAVAERADLVVLTGDVADETNKFWEAIGPLTEAVERLSAAGIPVLAVAGNHDHDVLPRLADRLAGRRSEDGGPEGFRLLGRGGTWERWTLERAGRPVLHVDGWSFPGERVHRSPLEAYPERAAAGVPVLGVLHGDLDVAGSRYAPLASADLRSRPVLGWLLGHVHAPRIEPPGAEPFICYPGSPQALDPGEPGRHGAVRLRIEAGRVAALEPVALSTVRYDEVAVDVTGADEASELDRRVQDALEAHGRAAAAEGGGVLERLVLRLRLLGRSAVAGLVDDRLRGIVADLELPVDGVAVTVERARSEVRPDLDLEQLAAAGTPAGALARVLLELERAGGEGPVEGEAATLLQAIRDGVERVRSDRAYDRLGADGRRPAEPELRTLARAQAARLLARMVEPGGDGEPAR